MVVELLVKRATTHRRRGAYEAMVSSLSEAIRLQPDLPNLYRTRALDYHALGDEATELEDKQTAEQSGN